MTNADKVEAARLFLESMADHLDKWAQESKDGGWSTHQVSQNISAANDCRRIAATLKVQSP